MSAKERSGIRSVLAALVSTVGFAGAGCEDFEIHAVPDRPFRCEDEEWRSARTNPFRFIAHGAGEIDGRRYTNSREALDAAYRNGLRLFEIDLIQTSDGHHVGAHDWDTWRNATASRDSHPTHRKFKTTLLFNQYHPLDLAELDQWFGARPDTYLVTDKISDFKRLLNGFSHESRLIVEVFSVDDYHRAVTQGVQYPMLALIPALTNNGKSKVVELLQNHPVKFISVPSKAIRHHSRLLAELRRNKTCVYAYTSSDAEFLERNFGALIFGVYTDQWNTQIGACSAVICDTY